jgi:hypothetical protein
MKPTVAVDEMFPEGVGTFMDEEVSSFSINTSWSSVKLSSYS